MVMMERKIKMIKKSDYGYESIIKGIYEHLTVSAFNSPLMERRDYASDGHDQLEEGALDLKEEEALPGDLEKEFGIRLDQFPDKKSHILDAVLKGF